MWGHRANARPGRLPERESGRAKRKVGTPRQRARPGRRKIEKQNYFSRKLRDRKVRSYPGPSTNDDRAKFRGVTIPALARKFALTQLLAGSAGKRKVADSAGKWRSTSVVSDFSRKLRDRKVRSYPGSSPASNKVET